MKRSSLLVVVGWALGVTPGLAQPCQLTEIAAASVGSFETMWPMVSGDGTAVAFRSDRDLVAGSNADGNWELFLWTPSGIQQLTDTTVSSSLAIGPPSISNDGQAVVFSSSLDLTGGNADGNYEVFLFRLPASLTQLTSTTGPGPTGILNDGPVISGDGEVVAFLSAADLLGTNADGSFEVYTWRAATGFEQITATNVDSGYPSIDGTGATLAHLSSADLTPPANADGNAEVFLHAPPAVTQVTSTFPPDFIDHPRLSQTAARLVFTSSADLLPPGNADHSVELFVFDPSSGFSQLTSTLGPGFIGNPSLDAEGDTVVFQSNRDLLPPQNVDGNSEIFVWRSGGGLSQLTFTPASSHHSHPTSSLGGTVFAFELLSATQRSVVLAVCRGPVTEIPTLAPLGLLALATVLVGLSLVVLRRPIG